LKSRHIRHARKRGEAGADMVVGDKVEMQPCFRDILKPDRNVPWLPWRNHENRYLVSRTGRHQPDWRMATESEKARRRPSRHFILHRRHSGAPRKQRARNPQPPAEGYGFRARHLRWRSGMTEPRI